jgi:Na+/melibiose symporter-like transporter
MIGAAQRLGNLLAYAVGGFLVGQLTQARFVLAITATACAVAVGWLVTFTLKEPQVEAEHAEKESALALLQDGVRLFRAKPRFLRLVLLSLATIAFKDSVSGFYQPYFIKAGVPPIWLGLALSLAAGLSILGTRYAYWLEARLGTRLSLLLVTGVPGLLHLLMGSVMHPVFSVLIFCSLYSSMSLKAPLFSGHLNRHITSKNRATVLSLISMASGLYVALMGLLIGYIADISLRAAFVAMGIMVLGGTLLFRAQESPA